MPKTESGFRNIPLTDDMVNYLQSVIPKYEMFDYIFTKQSGGIFTKSAFDKMWYGIIKKAQEKSDAKIEGLTSHILRHTFATDCILAKLDIETIRKILGHKDIQTTLKYYIHIVVAVQIGRAHV